MYRRTQVPNTGTEIVYKEGLNSLCGIQPFFVYTLLNMLVAQCLCLHFCLVYGRN